ncbi:4-deoxy-L-threo-5-hexosulose-uronate ketol-isomerase [Breznakibacter xylanolyticus]|uniref:4-deoxy-L-threo-5-hexosulose-uronate ketol-isomerase n=1 Tax=Breznakibacter xylanolyticus TaxID=990 RepID=A0A2W7N649_9BACT|nr:5-dehydro-4-deoxy-D-glucuronate isomerase [Breznakibacter xylanolyticus]MBN2743884.1 5-dehydro-4-deoxy-D-glucuronate isomerase [Marinilabiliaceae bacterium]PZX12334.1 4-deoxy-L-threo-5-hexosulose-uronate ketol-isomerase [Breznakibacter xylanolyticus]
MKYEIRYASHPEDAKNYDTTRIRKEFLIPTLFEKDEISLVYSMYDRYIVGGAMPVTKALKLETIEELKADFFLRRREMGIINVGGDAKITADGVVYELKYKEALYIGMGTKEVIFESTDKNVPAKLYINSAPAHHAYPSKKVTKAEAEVVEMGSLESSNHRTINKLIVNSVVPSCQLQMGMTELKPGSVWNTMPAHTHNRRMEAYFYFEVPANQTICHFMGQPDETRHIFMNNDQAVLSPSWSIHSAAGTSNYTFIWGMAGENLDYSDMDIRQPNELK